MSADLTMCGGVAGDGVWEPSSSHYTVHAASPTVASLTLSIICINYK